MEAAHYPPNGGPHAGAPSYNGPLSMNDPSYRREQYSQQTMTGQQGYNMYPPAPPQVTSSQAHGQPSYQPPQQLQNTQPPQNPQQGNTQSGQQFNPEVKQEEDQGGQGAMIGQTPDGTGPNALLPLVSNSMGTAPKGPQEIPPSFSMIELGRRYTLEVVQQPQRARMCGFGDKDRRPITPPPCIRLVITDIATGVEVDVNDIEYGLFVLNVDLWSEDGTKEVNLVRHSTASPAISSTIPTSFMQAQAGDTNVSFNPLPHPTGLPSIVREPQYPYHHYPPSQQQQQSPGGYNQYSRHQSGNGSGNGSGYGQYPNSQYQQQQQQPPQYGGYSPASTQQQPRRPSSRDYGMPSREVANHHVFYHTGSTLHAVAANAPRPQNHDLGTPQHYDQYARMGSIAPTPTPQGMYTRNLIGSLSASAFRLADTNEKIGIWFVLQDLSVRTEGNFRLRFSFCNVGIPSKTPNGNPANQMSIINTGRAPILASCYSEPFTVYSAKKFPGVVESTPLSKKFATQGIKIPIRKDGAPKKSRGGDDGEGFDD